MKKVLIVVLVLFLVIGLVGCRKAQENAVENMIEGMMEAQSGENIDIDIDDSGDDEGSITISGDDGKTTIEGDEAGMPWPVDKLPDNVPKIPGVKVLMVMDEGGGTAVVFNECDKSMAEAYVTQLEQLGWNIDMNMNSSDGMTVMFTNDADEFLQLYWGSEDGGSGSISYAKE